MWTTRFMYSEKAEIHSQKKVTLLRKIAIYWFTLLLVCTLCSRAAHAHANLLVTTPTNMSVVETTPERVLLDFSEPLEADLIELKLYDWDAREIDLPPPTLSKGNASQMTVELPTLQAGTYTVIWGVVSEDGHPVKGSFVFSVGTATEHRIDLNVDGTDLPNPWLVGLRYVVESVLLLGGGLFFFTRWSGRYHLPEYEQLISRRTRNILWLLLLLLSLGQWFVYSSTLPGSGLASILLHGNWNLLIHTPFALMVSVQILLLLLLALPGMQTLWYGIIWTLLATNLAFGGHALGTEPVWLSLTARAVHTLSLALWLGGLAYLALTFVYAKRNKRHIDRSRFRTFFTRSAIITTLLVIISGVIMTTLQTDWPLLFQGSLWSNLLLLKIAIMAIMLVIALIQTIRWRRVDSQLSHAGLRLELLAGVFALFVAVLISQMSYPVPIKPYAHLLQATAGEATASVQIPELRIGSQTLTSQLPDLHGKPPEKVVVRLEMTDMEMGDLESTATRLPTGDYQAKLNFSMTGKWQYTIEATYADDVKLQWTDTVILPRGGTR